MKKRILTVACASLLLVSGCSNATTQVKDDDKVLIKVGDEEITKGDIYTGLVAQGNITPVQRAMSEILVDKLVKVDDDIKKQADEDLAYYKEMYGDQWETTYKSYGYKDEEAFYNDVILLNARMNKLTSLYVKDNLAELVKEFKPRKAQVFQVKDEEKAKKALEAAKKKDADFTAIAKEYGDEGTYNGSEAIYNTNSGLPDVVWKYIEEADKNGVVDNMLQDPSAETYYIVKVTEKDYKKFKEEAITNISEISISASTEEDAPKPLADRAFAYFLDKYDYSIHDVNIYQDLLSSSSKFEK
ncbi:MULTISPECIES: peptidyl-prolyl cis-trans isomerase [unclassified Breznakia]|uniref:peptidyl-prolyl cis-trans isomerase n=1 Tax=unclassified Breznakia TaxID=2623764 RepID=UPI0024735F06|nr:MULTISPECIES: peptidyl-prolyl cis-trans isomerase [unclassified Breznakia]MDH6367776.1 foldase protein PrsA [Breznakia sp. PH1-1]MDH6404870.1 foldase protein PrsA [Breznakia sp. PF1-11]MDH6412585.1 foldase protein PrsA [Breznakia sp. PFB1-11]MDH6414939.1 foldase protein PrsA [Breznakia sp. PFB1-14]MDH6417250.1 foldase protein PrsA [Breznakia sp. PFB1-4]